MNKKTKDEKVKKSLVLSGLVGTAGLFIAKLLGLIYSIPLSTILGSDAYMNYYGTAYRIYSYVLNIFTAGFPFAIATMVAKYTVRDDARSLRKIKVISHTLMTLIGFLGMLVLFAFSWLLAKVVANGTGVPIMGNCLRILSLAIFFVPILSSYRGFWQGRKEMGEYALSQVFEQIFRVGFLLTMAFLIVYVFHQERVYALYAAVMSTSVAAVAGIIQIVHFDHQNYGEIEEAARIQRTRTCSKRKLYREFISLALPYLGVAVLGYSDDVYNSILLPLGLRLAGYTGRQQDVILSATNYVGTKITAIPMILSPGFAAALIPHITSARAEHDNKKVERNVVDCINIILYIGAPVSLCIALYAMDIYHILFYTSDIALAGACLRWMAVEGFAGTLMPVITNIMMALGMKKESLQNLTVYVVIKGVSLIVLLKLCGYAGIALSTVPGCIYLIIRSCRQMSRAYGISFRQVLKASLRCLAGLVVMTLVCLLARKIGLDGTVGGKLLALLKVVINIILSLGAYLVVTSLMKVPQMVFHTDFISAMKRHFGRRHQKTEEEQK
jgi:O-antigen/teichoic acid export membrane protein